MGLYIWFWIVYIIYWQTVNFRLKWETDFPGQGTPLKGPKRLSIMFYPFLIYINDQPDPLYLFAFLFTDDLKLITSSCKALMMQNDLETLDRWQDNWLLWFNNKYKKLKVIRIVLGPRLEYWLGE